MKRKTKVPQGFQERSMWKGVEWEFYLGTLLGTILFLFLGVGCLVITGLYNNPKTGNLVGLGWIGGIFCILGFVMASNTLGEPKRIEKGGSK